MWFLAQLGIEMTVGGDRSRCMTHINFHIIESIELEAVFEKAIQLGSNYNFDYSNSDGEIVSMQFAGLLEITVINEPLADLSEVYFEELPRRLRTDEIKSKDELWIFKNRDRLKWIPTAEDGSQQETAPALEQPKERG